MNEDLNEKIKSIGSMFGIENIPDNIGEMVNSFLSSNNSNNNDEKNSEFEKINNDVISDIDIQKCVQIMNKFKTAQANNNNDKKIKLLYAIEPFLNNKRKDKVNNCVKFLTFASIAKDLKLF